MLALPRSLILTSYLYTQQASTVVQLASDWRQGPWWRVSP